MGKRGHESWYDEKGNMITKKEFDKVFVLKKRGEFSELTQIINKTEILKNENTI